jgi:hypothetical protein
MKRTALKRKTPLRPINPERSKRETERAYGPVARRIWVRSLPCTVPGCRSNDIVQAHVSPEGRPSGMARKGDACQIIPLCFGHHAELHQIGQDTFNRMYNIDVDLAAMVIDCRWKESASKLWED